MRRTLIVGVVLLLGAGGCGGDEDGRTGPPSTGQREWAIGASLLVEGLQEALGHVANAGVGPSSLRDPATLYEALLGYAFLGDCDEGVRKLGEADGRLRPVQARLTGACSELEHASALFTSAVQKDDSSLLAAAAREALGTAPVLARVQDELRPLVTRG